MIFTPAQLAQIVARTLADYESRVQDFWSGTKDHDVTQNIDALLRHIRAEPPYSILDLGCGPGRDLLSFRRLGHDPVGLDGAIGFVRHARDLSGCEVWHQDFLALDLPDQHFDGVFANASLFHVPAQELPRVLSELYACLKSDGVLFCSNPHGQDEQGWVRDRFGAFHSPKTWRHLVSTAGFVELEHFYRPAGQPRERQPWLATVWRKTQAHI